jgi:hypothetical protein
MDTESPLEIPMTPRIRIATAFLLAALPSVPPSATEGHVHGEANLSVALEGTVLTLELSAPTHSLVGFEHTPQTGEEHAALERLIELLQQVEALFVPTPEAECQPQAVRIESPVLDPEPETATRPIAETRQQPQAHAGLEAEFQFQCASPEVIGDIEVRLFDLFPAIKRLNVKLAGPKGRRHLVLTAGQRGLAW